MIKDGKSILQALLSVKYIFQITPSYFINVYKNTEVCSAIVRRKSVSDGRSDSVAVRLVRRHARAARARRRRGRVEPIMRWRYSTQ